MFDAVVFHTLRPASVAEIAAELAVKLKPALETRPPEEQIAAAKVWLAVLLPNGRVVQPKVAERL